MPIRYTVATIAQIPSTSLNEPITRSASGRAPGNFASPQTAYFFEIFGYCRDASILDLPCRAPNDFHSIFGNLLSHGDTKGNAHQVSVLKLNPWPLVAVIQ